jgi:hypothetical protein
MSGSFLGGLLINFEPAGVGVKIEERCRERVMAAFSVLTLTQRHNALLIRMTAELVESVVAPAWGLGGSTGPGPLVGQPSLPHAGLPSWQRNGSRAVPATA